MKYTLRNTRCLIHHARPVQASTETHGPEAKVRNVAHVELRLSIGQIEKLDTDKSFAALADKLFPQSSEIAANVAADDARSGYDWNSRGKLPDLTASFFAFNSDDVGDQQPIITLSGAKSIGKPKLKIDEGGHMVMEIKLRCRMDKTALWKAIEYYAPADVYLSFDSIQTDIEDGAPAPIQTDIEGPKTKVRLAAGGKSS